MKKFSKNPFPSAFYVANCMEIFERFAWYGVYTLLALYLTSPKSQNGLELDQAQKGLIMGVVPFFLYLFPIISGALADRYGYKKMFIASFCIMAPSYYFLGTVNEMESFLGFFMMVALGAGIFKPVVTGTIARTTDATNRGLGFGIFYMMVNIGGALGPLIAPLIQKNLGWDWVFIFAAIWITINFIPVLFFYKEPVKNITPKPFKIVMQEMQLVLGNGRLALLVFPLLVLIVAYNANLIRNLGDLSSEWVTLIFAITLIVICLVWDFFNLRFKSTPSLPWYKQRMKLGNKPFMVYLIIMSGFWTVYLQLFITLPSYTRDFVDTSDLVRGLESLGPWFYSTFAAVDLNSINSEILRLSENLSSPIEPGSIQNAQKVMASLDLRIPLIEIERGLQIASQSPEQIKNLTRDWSEQYRQINPGTLLGLDFLMIVFFQILISNLIKKWNLLVTLIAGTMTLSIGLWIGGTAHGMIIGGTTIVTSILVFATGEMIASPKSQEYVASFAPKNQVAMFMGYYFVALALGNLFAGLLSGWLYQSFAINQNSPGIMWAIIGGLGLLTCIALFIFSQTMVEDIKKQQQLAEAHNY